MPSDATRSAGPSGRRLLLFRFVLVAAGLALGLLLVEGLLRLAVNLYQPDEELGWGFVPGKVGFKFARTGEFAHPVRINSHGFRDAERSHTPPEGTQRILVLGDSYAAGLQVRFGETFQQLLEGRLNAEAAEGRFEVLNLGVDGYGTAQELLLYEERAHRYGADVVVVSHFPFNDLSDNAMDTGSLQHWLAYSYGRPYFVRENGELVRRWRTGLEHWDLEGPLAPLLRSSMLYVTFHPVPGSSADRLPFRHADVYDRDFGEALQESWSVTRALLGRLEARVREEGAELVVMLVSERKAVRGERGSIGPLAETLAGDGRRVLDLEPRLARHPLRDEGPLYFEKDPHWNARGHRAVADAMESFLREHCAALGLALPPCRGGR